MYFASKFILNNEEEDEYECISDDEFHGGMELSGSSSGSDSDGAEPTERKSPKKSRVKLKHHWRQNQKLPLTSTDGPRPPATSKRWFRRADTNVVSVSFDTLMSPGNMHAGDPVICSTCGAILSHISKPATENDSMVWKCEFCDNTMSIDIVPEEIPAAEETTFLMEAGKATTLSSVHGRDESLVVFCVDTSGSMCVTSEVDGKVKLRGTSHLQRLGSFNTEGESQYLPSQKNHNVTYVSRLQSMQAAVDHQLGEMAKNFPHRRVALVTFSNDVMVLGDGYQEEITVAGDKLVSMDQLTKIGSEIAPPQAIQRCHKKLGEKVYKLEEGGATALGPALVIAVNMAASQAGSKVIVCTDGKANIGLGKLEDEADNETGTEFYTSIGDDAVTKGVSISVTTIKGTDCKLVHLGQLADKTGGQVNVVDPLNLTKEFGNILADQIIATNVKSKFLVHKALYILDEDNPENRMCFAEFSPGNVQANTAITFEFARRTSKDKDQKDGEEGKAGGDDTSNVYSTLGGATEKGKQEVEADGAEAKNVYDNLRESFETVYDNVAKESSNAENTLPKIVVEGASAASPPPQVPPREGAEALKEFPFQLQIEYVDTEGTKAMRVITRTIPATADRKMAESNADLEVLGTHAAKKSADLALQGEYTRSRGTALMNQRLAWRSCQSDNATSTQRSKYKNIYSRLKTMENRLQRKQTSEVMSRGRTYSDDESDDELDFYEQNVSTNALCVDSVDSAALPLPPPRASSDKLVKRKKKKCAERSIEMDDSFANMAYQFRRVSHRTVSQAVVGEASVPAASVPALPPPRKSRADASASDSD